MTQAKIQMFMVEFSSNWKYVNKLPFQIDLEKIVKLGKKTFPKYSSIFLEFFLSLLREPRRFLFQGLFFFFSDQNSSALFCLVFP